MNPTPELSPPTVTDSTDLPDDNEETNSHKRAEKIERYRLERGRIRMKLIVDLAKDEKTHQELADEIECSRSAVSMFARKHKMEIQAERDKARDALSELWISNRATRVAQIQQIAEDLESYMYLVLASGGDPTIAALAKAQLRCLHDAAVELGQLKEVAAQSTLSIVVRGVDTDVMR